VHELYLVAHLGGVLLKLVINWWLFGCYTRRETTSVFGIGQAGDIPITGDWNWDGDDDVGVYRAFDANYSNNPAFYFDLNRKN